MSISRLLAKTASWQCKKLFYSLQYIVHTAAFTVFTFIHLCVYAGQFSLSEDLPVLLKVQSAATCIAGGLYLLCIAFLRLEKSLQRRQVVRRTEHRNLLSAYRQIKQGHKVRERHSVIPGKQPAPLVTLYNREQHAVSM